MKSKAVLTLLLVSGAVWAKAQSTPEQLRDILKQPIVPQSVVSFQLQEYLMGRVPKLPTPGSAEEWTAKADQIREHILNSVVYYGWPQEWVDAPPHFQDMGEIPAGEGYRLRKFRYEIVPGFWCPALLYEPEHLKGKVPAILRVHGHWAIGKSEEFIQKACINYALRGILTLDLEYIGMGQLNVPENAHVNGPVLDLVGVNDFGLHYLAMRRGLDYLWENPQVDRGRIGMTGISGGGWQSIILGALDKRMSFAIPAAGYQSLISGIELNDLWDPEGSAPDLLKDQDYIFLGAIRAPRPTLLIYDAEDNCCYPPLLTKPYVFDAIKPFYALYGKEDELQWYINTNPGTHNYHRDNREQSYAFFDKYFKLQAPSQEIPVGPYIKSSTELDVPLPSDNLTMVGLARLIASQIHHAPIPSGPARATWAQTKRSQLREVVRYHPVTVKHPWATGATYRKEIDSESYRFELTNGLSATGVRIKAITTPENAPLTLLIADDGKEAADARASDRLNREDQVLAANMLFFGDDSPTPQGSWGFSTLAYALGATGDRPLGIEAAQMIALAHWALERYGVPSIRLETIGIRSEVVALVATSLEPTLFSQLVIHGGKASLRFLLDGTLLSDKAPDLFCLDLYKDFDLEDLVALAGPTQITWEDMSTPK